MTDGYDDQTDDLVPRSQIRELEAQAKRARELEAQVAAMQRESVFARALGNTEHPARQYFERGYDGELDVDAIRIAAKDAGLIGAPPQATSEPDLTSNPTPQELAAHARMQASSEGAQGTRPIDLMEAFGPRGSKKPEEIARMARQAGLRLAEDQQ